MNSRKELDLTDVAIENAITAPTTITIAKPIDPKSITIPIEYYNKLINNQKPEKSPQVHTSIAIYEYDEKGTQWSISTITDDRQLGYSQEYKNLYEAVQLYEKFARTGKSQPKSLTEFLNRNREKNSE